MKTIKPKLDNRQIKILQGFIQTFLPPTNNKRKYTANELDYIHGTLDKLFIQKFGFNLTRQSIYEAFVSLGYETFTRNGEWNREIKEVIPSKKGEVNNKMVGKYFEQEAAYTYFEVSADSVRNLRKSTATLPRNTNQIKSDTIEELKANIQTFVLLWD